MGAWQGTPPYWFAGWCRSSSPSPASPSGSRWLQRSRRALSSTRGARASCRDRHDCDAGLRLAAYLLGGRFRDSRRIDDMLLFAALIGLSLASATASSGMQLPRTTRTTTSSGARWPCGSPQACCWPPLPSRAIAHRRRPSSSHALRIGAIVVLLAVAALVLIQPRLSTGIDPMLAPAAPGDLAVAGTPGFVATQFSILVLLMRERWDSPCGRAQRRRVHGLAGGRPDARRVRANQLHPLSFQLQRLGLCRRPISACILRGDPVGRAETDSPLSAQRGGSRGAGGAAANRSRPPRHGGAGSRVHRLQGT